MGKIVKYLNQLSIGNVFDSPEILDAYATDCSILTVKPRFVAFPESTEDISKILKFCYQLADKNLKIPITPCGSGLDEGGNDIGNGLIISTEKMSRLLEADSRERLVRVQPGITIKELNTALSMCGLTIPVGGCDQKTVGELIASSQKDDFFGKYGGIGNYVEKIEVVLPNGEIIQTDRLRKRKLERILSEKTVEGRLYRRIIKLADSNIALINDLKSTKNNLTGYPGVTKLYLRESFDLMPLFFGAEGTLGIITEVILRAVPIRDRIGRVVASFENFSLARAFLEELKRLNPRELNIYDARVIKIAESTGKKLSQITEDIKSGFIVFASFDSRVRASLRHVEALKSGLKNTSLLFIDSPVTKPILDEFENSLISFINQAKSGERAPILTDFYIPPENLEGFLADLGVLERNLGMKLALYGSYSSSNYNLRPKLDVTEPEFNKKVTALLRTGAYVIARRNGSLAGGTPEGRLKALITNAELTEKERMLYTKIKEIFDEKNIMNPAIKLGATADVNLRHFRTTSSAKIVV